MPRIERGTLLSLEAYARERPVFRARVMEHKRHRTAALGEYVRLIFEDELTIRYQVQEMLRAERIFEESGIREELDAYNPLIPDGRNFKATLMLEYPDADERRRELALLKGVERRVWMEVAARPRVWAIADEDLERENDEKTSSVHFLRFDVDDAAAQALKRGAPLSVGIDHPRCQASIVLPREVRDALVKDLT
jgi:uncharacterized protein DUF3501